ncbi:alanine--tRNA ligase [Oceanidesulfovibrio indonesiensis]|uniref:Alanine--tRNA ligase n=1 Tax=Oceanidesulfovibrio indonesiensis TaxID=54767 RepID=A0A7M3MCR4_9BACT|nr:alanine--tRNA ligase [Oceanidesulfovibrio indonesiensis]TVM16267.1 alanine--tRNA ligase [Oceanidesulfovibrio indonesiensis]
MSNLTAGEIRRRFLDYFNAHGHSIVESAPLIPKDDPTLLFTNAGMVQFKKLFLGQEKRDYVRATTSQKCLRVGGKHNDLENVGRTARHHTFFEMLGNFSFGDYFKEEAIGYAWEFLTKELGLDPERLYATVYTDDDEAADLWQKVAGVPKERIYRLGEKDNFWSMGDTGPCGPCSEILYDQGEHVACGPECGIGVCECDRYLEIWNLVFMQYDQLESGERVPLPRPSIDTGMGLERVAAVCQGVYSNFDINLFQEIIGYTAKLSGVAYDAETETGTAHRVIADHSRSIAFMIADGILPSNEGRGYVLRRLIRRAFRFGRLLGLRDPFLHKTAFEVVRLMGDAFPELVERKDFMEKVVREEEERFSLTLDKGLAMLSEELERIAEENGARVVSGEFAFRLYDTYGFPIDIVNDIAEREGFTVDEKGYEEHMAAQRKRAKAAWKGSGETDLGSVFHSLLEEGVRSRFTGYERLAEKSKVSALLDESGNRVPRLATGQKGYLVTEATPFYGESGGQLGDAGTVVTPSGRAAVSDALKPNPHLTAQVIEVEDGEIAEGQEAELVVEEGPRMATARNHTATHLLHSALRTVLGDHVKQAGSLVGPDRLRFDFTHIAALTPEETAAVEREVNRAVLADVALCTESLSYEEAVARGAIALFGEKYEDEVRVVSVPDFSTELCGGTHLESTGQTGPFVILSEAGVAAGVRRIEAATGWNALKFYEQQRAAVNEVAGALKLRSAAPEDVVKRIRHLQDELRKLTKENEKLAAKAASAKGGDIMDGLREIGGVKLLTAKVDSPNVKALRDLMDDVRSKLPSGVACLVAENEGKVPLILYVSKDLHDRFTAPQLIKPVAEKVGGSGGGRPDLAQAGGTDASGIAAAFETLETLLAG